MFALFWMPVGGGEGVCSCLKGGDCTTALTVILKLVIGGLTSIMTKLLLFGLL